MTGAWAATVAFLLTAFSVCTFRPVARRIGLTDRPNHRKVHDGEIPLVGGVAIFAAFAATGFVTGFASDFAALLAGGAFLVVMGAYDDRRELEPRVRLIGQCLAALIMCLGGDVVVQDLGTLLPLGSTLELGVLSLPFTVFCTAALINSVNMSDGIDGLAGLQSLLSLGGIALALAVTGVGAQDPALLALCGCLVAFLAFNLRTPWRRKAAVFLGDSGSNFLGFALAWFLIRHSQGQGASLLPAAALWFVTLQVYDTVTVVVRRLIHKRSPFAADREHLHHVFLLAGFSVSQTVGVLAFLTIVGVAVGVLGSVFQRADIALFLGFAVGGFLFLGGIARTWRTMRFARRAICRRHHDRRRAPSRVWLGPERRSGHDRRFVGREVGKSSREADARSEPPDSVVVTLRRTGAEAT